MRYEKMITYKFFMENFDLSEAEAKDKMNKIKAIRR